MLHKVWAKYYYRV